MKRMDTHGQAVVSKLYVLRLIEFYAITKRLHVLANQMGNTVLIA